MRKLSTIDNFFLDSNVCWHQHYTDILKFFTKLTIADIRSVSKANKTRVLVNYQTGVEGRWWRRNGDGVRQMRMMLENLFKYSDKFESHVLV